MKTRCKPQPADRLGPPAAQVPPPTIELVPELQEYVEAEAWVRGLIDFEVDRAA